MPPKNTAFTGTALPRTGLNLLGTSLRTKYASPRLIPTRTAVRAITKKVSDIKFYPEQSKEERRARRKKEKHEALRERRDEKKAPRGFGDRPGVGIGPLGSSRRAEAERNARMDYLEEKPGMRNIAMRITHALSGGKADMLLHTLRARWLERMEAVSYDEEVELMDDVKIVYQRLIDEILFCDSLYYCDKPKPRVSDENYDELVMHLLELERWFPELISPRSPTQNVGHGAAVRASKLGLDNELNSEPMTALSSNMATVSITEKRFPQYRHKTLMLSLDNAYKHDDLVSFSKRAKEANSKLSAELKIDGVALSLEYRNRKLHSASTRGNGRIGDDITENVRAAVVGRGIVDTIEDVSAPDFIVVRGEVYITPSDFEQVNCGLEKKLSNARNAAAGALKHKDPAEAKARLLSFCAYECLTANLQAVEKSEEDARTRGESEKPFSYPELHSALPCQDEMFLRLSEWGFGEMPRHEVCDTIEEGEAFALRIEEERMLLPLEADGVVFKFEDSAAREAAGHTARAPRGAIAYKFAAQSKLTYIEDVVMQVSRNGLITPVAVLQPVRVGGALLSRATLHNFDEVKRLKVAVGDKVRVERGGDVIPKIVKVEEESQLPDRKPIEPPSECPSCHGEIVSVLDEKTRAVLVGCRNAQNCTAQIRGRVIHFCGKEAMDIRGLGTKTADKLISSGLVVVLADLFRLTLDDMLGLEGYAERSAKLLLDSIQAASSSRSLERVIFGLGLPGVGRTGARALASTLKSLDKLVDLANDKDGVQTLLAVPNFAEKSAEAVHLHLNREQTMSDIKAIVQYVKPKSVVDEEEYEGMDVPKDLSNVVGKSFVFTGKLEIMSRPEVKKWITAAGGIVSATVSSKTDYVIAGSDPGHKFFKAQRLKVKTLQEEEFLELFKRARQDPSILVSKI